MSDTTSVNSMMGQIGAAKIFSSSISGSLGSGQQQNEELIRQLEEQLQSTTDEKQRAKIQKKIKRLRKSNNIMNGAQKVTSGATSVLLEVAKFCDMGKKEIIEWLSYMLTAIVPGMEVAVKTILLTNIKKMVSCSLDPRIPDGWRTSGVTINECEIDPRGILGYSPYSAYGKDMYFGVVKGTGDEEWLEPLHSLSRAEDMNAFLWYAKNCAKYVSPVIVENQLSNGKSGLTAMFADVSEKDTLYNKHFFKGDGTHWYLPGCTFKQGANSNTIFLCVDKVTALDETVYYTIVPCTNSWTSVNWYKSRQNYDKSKPLFNIEYSNQYNESATLPRNNFRFKILPKPFQIGGGLITDMGSNVAAITNGASTAVDKIFGTDLLDDNENGNKMVWPNIISLTPRLAKFDGNGKYSKSGKYTIHEDKYYVQQRGYTKIGSDSKAVLNFELVPKTGSNNMFLLYDTRTKEFIISKSVATEAAPQGETPTKAQIDSVLIEAYTGKTIYEFNYDYIMSFRLFDAKVIAADIVKGLLNIKFDNPLKKWFKKKDPEEPNTEEIYVSNYIDQLIQAVIEEQDTEYSDCFYSFSNDEYIALEEKTNQQLINGSLETSFNEDIETVYDLLNAYSTDASLHEQTSTLTTMLTKVSEMYNDVSTGGNGGTNDSLTSANSKNENDFINQAVKIFIGAVVNALLSPKVLLLIQINKKLMGNDPLSLNRNYNFEVQDILNGMKGVLSAMIKEVIDTIQKELLRIIMKQITIILNSYMKQLAMEYAQKWVNLLKQLLMCFKFNKNSMDLNGNGGDNTMSAINSALDNIENADIDTLAEELIPQTNNC